MHFDLFGYLFSLAILYLYGRLLLHYGAVFIRFMVNDQYVWKVNLEKPRMLFTLVGLGFMHLMLYAQNNSGSEHYLFQSITVVTFFLAFFLAQMAWTENFESKFEVKKSHQFQKINNFEFKISESQIQELYNELTRYDLLCPDKTNLEAFNRVLTENWDCHDSKIYLKLDGPSSREFYENLVKSFPKNSSTLKIFFETSGVIVRADGKPYKYNTIKNAPTRTPVSKHSQTLNDIFQKLK